MSEFDKDHAWLMVSLAEEIVSHIRRYWSLDGQPLPEPRLGEIGNADDFRCAAELLAAVGKDRAGDYPGPVIEWQLRGLIHAWDRVDPIPCTWRKTPTELLDRMFPCPVGDAACTLSLAVRTVLPRAKRPGTFSSEQLCSIGSSAKTLRQLIEFIPTELQGEVLEVLDGRAMTLDKLVGELDVSRAKVIYGNSQGKKLGERGGIKELSQLGLVQNERRLGGYYRPDAPPA